MKVISVTQLFTLTTFGWGCLKEAVDIAKKSNCGPNKCGPTLEIVFTSGRDRVKQPCYLSAAQRSIKKAANILLR